MSIIITIIHIVACISLMLVVLMQAGKGAGMGAAFGGSSQTVFGSAGATTFLGRVTAIIAIVFIVTSLAITIFSDGKSASSVMRGATPAPLVQDLPTPSIPTTPVDSGNGNQSQGGSN